MVQTMKKEKSTHREKILVDYIRHELTVPILPEHYVLLSDKKCTDTLLFVPMCDWRSHPVNPLPAVCDILVFIIEEECAVCSFYLC